MSFFLWVVIQKDFPPFPPSGFVDHLLADQWQQGGMKTIDRVGLGKRSRTHEPRAGLAPGALDVAESGLDLAAFAGSVVHCFHDGEGGSVTLFPHGLGGAIGRRIEATKQ